MDGAMVSSEAKTVASYLKQLRPDRREAMTAVRKVILKNLPKGYEEGMQGMITYSIPLKDLPKTYNGDPLWYVGLASQTNYMALYLNNVYSDPEIADWFKARYKATGKRLDMGKSCVRFKKLEDLPLDLIGETVAATSKDELIKMYLDPSKTDKRRK
jgi:hypothetical protein